MEERKCNTNMSVFYKWFRSKPYITENIYDSFLGIPLSELKGTDIVKPLHGDFYPRYFLTNENTVYDSKLDKIRRADSKGVFNLTISKDYRKRLKLRSLYKNAWGVPLIVDNIKNKFSEIWKPIPNTDNLYYVSNKGRIKSCVYGNVIILKPVIKNGYRSVSISYKGTLKSEYIHILVANAFCKRKEGQNEVHHKNYNKLCNTAKNLRWVTTEEHRKIHARHRKRMARQKRGE